MMVVAVKKRKQERNLLITKFLVFGVLGPRVGGPLVFHLDDVLKTSFDEALFCVLGCVHRSAEFHRCF